MAKNIDPEQAKAIANAVKAALKAALKDRIPETVSSGINQEFVENLVDTCKLMVEAANGHDFTLIEFDGLGAHGHFVSVTAPRPEEPEDEDED